MATRAAQRCFRGLPALLPAVLLCWAPPATRAEAAAAAAPTPAPVLTSQQLDEELKKKLEAAVRDDKLTEFRLDVDARLRTLLANPDAVGYHRDELETLEYYRAAGRTFDLKPAAETRSFILWLLGQRQFCSRFCHALDYTDRPEKAVEVLRRLKAVKDLDERTYLRHSEMAIAMALVWDDYAWYSWTRIKAPDERLEEIYAYYVQRGGEMRIPPDQLPHEVLRYVIDHPLGADERDYALKGFRNTVNLGGLFFDIVWTTQGESLAQGRNEKVAYTLMNIKKNGGVCMEQAYYATTIAKCLGVPATYCSGTGTRGGHAWTGILELSNGRYRWNFESGRYPYDHYWKGSTYDPTCRPRRLSDGEVAMTAGEIYVPRRDIESGDALRNLAVFAWLGLAAKDQPADKLPELSAAQKKLVRDLLLAAVKSDPYSRRTWTLAGALAARGGFSLVDVKTFGDLMSATAGNFSPDFFCHTLQKFLTAVENKAERDRLYEFCFDYFRQRPDLAAELKVSQGRMWEAEGRSAEALRAYVAAVASFPRDGHVTQEAAALIDQTLARGEPARAVETLRTLWAAMGAALQNGKPEEREAMRIIGENLVKYLKLAKMDREAAAFESEFRKQFPAQKR